MITTNYSCRIMAMFVGDVVATIRSVSLSESPRTDHHP
jgi:hypothetical protein